MYVEALLQSGIDHFVTVPDWIQWALHKRLEDEVEGLRTITCCNEDQAVTLAAGLTISGKRPIIAVQNQGFYACVNAVRAVALDARIPTVFLIGQFGREFANIGKDPAQSDRNMVKLLEPVLDALGIPSFRLDTPDDMPKVGKAVELAHGMRCATALIVGGPVAWN